MFSWKIIRMWFLELHSVLIKVPPFIVLENSTYKVEEKTNLNLNARLGIHSLILYFPFLFIFVIWQTNFYKLFHAMIFYFFFISFFFRLVFFSRERPGTWKVTLEQTNVLQLSRIKEYLRGDISEEPLDVLQALDVACRQECSKV